MGHSRHRKKLTKKNILRFKSNYGKFNKTLFNRIRKARQITRKRSKL